MNKDDIIYDQLKEISRDVKDIKANVDKNTTDLAYHIRRTDLLEKYAVLINWKSVGVFFGILGSIVSITWGIMRIIGG